MRISYEQILATLEAGLALAQRLGLDMELATTRFLAYREDLSRLIDVVALRQRLGRLPQDVIDDLERRKGRYVAALVESAQFGEIATKLAAVDADVLRPKLRDALRGPILPSDEDANSNQARNTIFELVLAARLHAAGLTPILGDRPDVRCVVADIPMSFECKRVFSEKKLALRISQAADSLQKDLTAAGPHAGRGVIVVSTAKLFSPAQMPLAIRGDPVAQQALNEWLEAV